MRVCRVSFERLGVSRGTPSCSTPKRAARAPQHKIIHTNTPCPSQSTPVTLSSTLAKAGHEAALGRAIDQWGVATVLAWADKDGLTLLHWACHGSNPSPKSAKTLLELGADPNRGTKGNNTPLHWCAYNGTASHQEIARHLIDHGADPRLEDEVGDTPLDFARSEGHTEMARLLEEYVASPPAAAPGPGQVRPPRPLCAATCTRRVNVVTLL